MKCKYCDNIIVSGKETIQYIKKGWKSSGKYPCSPQYIEGVGIDSGIFCCDECLIHYLHFRDK
jgi:hypothetical protein